MNSTTVSIVDNEVLAVAKCWLYFIIGYHVAAISFEWPGYFIFTPTFQEDKWRNKYDLLF